MNIVGILYFLIKVESGTKRVVFVAGDEVNVNNTDTELNSLILDFTSRIFRKVVKKLICWLIPIQVCPLLKFSEPLIHHSSRVHCYVTVVNMIILLFIYLLN